MDLIRLVHGEDVELYRDVLHLASEASDEEVQAAFVAQRLKLFKALQNFNHDSSCKTITLKDIDGSILTLTQRQYAEKKMDALVATFRLLSDPEKRRDYKASMRVKMALSKDTRSPSTARSVISIRSQTTSSSKNSSIEWNDVYSEYDETDAAANGNCTPKLNRSKGNSLNSHNIITSSGDRKIIGKRRSSSENYIDGESENTKTEDDDDSTNSTSYTLNTEFTNFSETENIEKHNESFVTPYFHYQGSTLAKWLRDRNWTSQADLIDDVGQEIFGSASDVVSAFMQVFGAFQIDESAIDKLSENIYANAEDVAKNQFRRKNNKIFSIDKNVGTHQ
jgi:hypothetical protein